MEETNKDASGSLYCLIVQCLLFYGSLKSDKSNTWYTLYSVDLTQN